MNCSEVWRSRSNQNFLTPKTVSESALAGEKSEKPWENDFNRRDAVLQLSEVDRKIFWNNKCKLSSTVKHGEYTKSCIKPLQIVVLFFDFFFGFWTVEAANTTDSKQLTGQLTHVSGTVLEHLQNVSFDEITELSLFSGSAPIGSSSPLGTRSSSPVQRLGHCIRLLPHCVRNRNVYSFVHCDQWSSGRETDGDSLHETMGGEWVFRSSFSSTSQMAFKRWVNEAGFTGGRSLELLIFLITQLLLKTHWITMKTFQAFQLTIAVALILTVSIAFYEGDFDSLSNEHFLTVKLEKKNLFFQIFFEDEMKEPNFLASEITKGLQVFLQQKNVSACSCFLPQTADKWK